MSSPTTTSLRPWDNDKDHTFTSLLGLDKDKIFAFFDDIANNPAKYAIKPIYHNDLKKALAAMREVALPQKSRIFQKQQQLVPVELTFDGVPINFYSLYDVLGWFMSVIGPAPAGAAEQNYLIPMAKLFCQWTKALADGTSLPVMCSVVLIPSASQSLISVDVSEDLSVLGASIPPAKQKVLCQQARLDLLEQHGFGVKECPGEKAPKVKGVPSVSHKFGSCAETFPFAMATILKGSSDKKDTSVDLQSMKGVAMVIQEATQSEGLYPSPKCLRDPCANCQFLISKMGVSQQNFHVADLMEYEEAKEAPATGAHKTSATSSEVVDNPLIGGAAQIARGVLSLSSQ